MLFQDVTSCSLVVGGIEFLLFTRPHGAPSQKTMVLLIVQPRCFDVTCENQKIPHYVTFSILQFFLPHSVLSKFDSQMEQLRLHISFTNHIP